MKKTGDRRWENDVLVPFSVSDPRSSVCPENKSHAKQLLGQLDFLLILPQAVGVAPGEGNQLARLVHLHTEGDDRMGVHRAFIRAFG